MLSESLQSWNQHFPSLQHEIKPPSVLQKHFGIMPINTKQLEFAQWVHEQPKVELHVHLEAAVSASFYDALNLKLNLFQPGDSPLNKLPLRFS